MIDYNKILKENSYGVLATLDDNKPKTRIFQYLFSEKDKVYLATTNNKNVYKQVNYSRFYKRELLGKYLLLLAKYIYQALRVVPTLSSFIFLIFQHQFSNVFYIQCRIVISINFNSTALTFITSF